MEANTNKYETLGSLFLEHAGGYVTMRAMMERRDNLLNAIAQKTLEPSEDVLRELCKLNIALGDAEK